MLKGIDPLTAAVRAFGTTLACFGAVVGCVATEVPLHAASTTGATRALATFVSSRRVILLDIPATPVTVLINTNSKSQPESPSILSLACGEQETMVGQRPTSLAERAVGGRA